MLNLAMLEQALSVVGSVGKGEITVMVKGTITVVLRTLTGTEVSAAREYMLEGGDDESPKDQVNRYKVSLLSYSIIQVGQMDLRSVSSIETGEVTATGVSVRIPKHQAVRKILETWSEGTTLALFQKYLELAYRVEAETEEAIQFEITDLDAEILRVEGRLNKLKAERERSNQTSTKHVELVSTVDTAIQQNERKMDEQIASVPVKPSTPPPVLVREPPVIKREPPPVRERVLPPQPAPPPIRSEPKPVATTYEDVGSMSDDIEAETQRLLAARRERLAPIEQPDVISVPVHSQAPHREALNLSDAILDTDAAGLTSARVAQARDPNMATLDVATVIPRPAPTLVDLNSENTGSRNPRFRR